MSRILVAILALPLLAGCATLNRMAEKANEPERTPEQIVEATYGPGGNEYGTQPAGWVARYGEPDFRVRNETPLGARLTLTWDCADGEFRKVTWVERALEDAVYYEILERTEATGDCD